MRGLKDKVGVVAGGARGIGAATARRLAEEGACVVIGDLLLDLAQAVAEDIAAKGGRAVAVPLDGTSAESQAEIVRKAVEAYGRLDFYHSNLAGGTDGDIDALNCPVEVLDKSFAINTKSHFLATQAALPVMLESGGGAMIYTSSGAAANGAAWQVAYPMTKNAIHALARHVAQKWGKQGVRANVICPGLVLTEAAGVHLTEEFRKQGLEAVPHTRLGKPEDIAAAVTFLASEDGEWVNGQVWYVNGGTLKRD
ncbi:SDR family NAD(P)-dependent oxidoreductase [Novosphingobium panipatense]|uniref:NAD(P)-dependent dehydrogenase, short-chain alcohol dehydrogenase family n=1 Tax=Novosphingobium panipatense TaxID=428991 RepID=A0ABY1Q5Y6_9SPHN|nr:SDR family oxidoreductase [Novosphingobium panipatense]SMP60878.1 NAD(P)-dependent dehydrogenase, short-chain alcohol dehydrogenase family [Novosphingobium panipatense]